MVVALAAGWFVVVIVGWQMVRGTGHGWQLLVWLSLVLGFAGPLVWWFIRRGARMGADAARDA